MHNMVLMIMIYHLTLDRLLVVNWEIKRNLALLLVYSVGVGRNTILKLLVLYSAECGCLSPFIAH